MATKHIEGHGTVLDGFAFASPDEAIDTATVFYQGKGKGGFDLAKEVTLAKNAAAAQFAWYSEEFGFVQINHPDAHPVTVVGMYVSEKID